MQRNVLELCPFIHGHTDADCKTFGRQNKSKKQAACFLENIVFLIREKVYTEPTAEI